MHGFDIPDDASRLVTIRRTEASLDLDQVFDALEADQVVLIRDVAPDAADRIVASVAEKFGLKEGLELQAAFADVQGHRRRVGEYFMTVNQRGDYQFISPHSEGTSSAGMQLAAFLCRENTVDGGETILLNVEGTDPGPWSALRERVLRGRLEDRTLTRGEFARARVHGLDLPRDLLKGDEQILEERDSSIPGLKLVDALAPTRKTFSRILGREVYVFWDSIASGDLELGNAFANLLRRCELFREPPGGLSVEKADYVGPRRVWRSGVDYRQVFRCLLVHKMAPGDLILQNNTTWTHSVANWSPGSGVRTVLAAFA